MASDVISCGRSVRWIRLGTASHSRNGSPVVLDATFINVLRIKSRKEDTDPKRHQLSPFESTYLLCEKNYRMRGSTSTKYEKVLQGSYSKDTPLVARPQSSTMGFNVHIESTMQVTAGLQSKELLIIPSSIAITLAI